MGRRINEMGRQLTGHVLKLRNFTCTGQMDYLNVQKNYSIGYTLFQKPIYVPAPID